LAGTSDTGPTVLQRIAQGDASAVQECIDGYGALVWSLTRRLCPNAAEADDVVQEIFIDLWKSAARFDPGTASEATFVAMIARRRLIDLRRRLSRRGESAELPEAVEAEGTSQEEVAEVRDEADHAQRAMAQLRPEQQRVLRMAVYDGLSHQQIADTTGMPLGTVKTHARRGLIRVRELLGVTPDAAGAAGGVS
jgi:RNA polymerase sigma-70 factor (ECF subfamily)